VVMSSVMEVKTGLGVEVGWGSEVNVCSNLEGKRPENGTV
jgi:hypothetical protein